MQNLRDQLLKAGLITEDQKSRAEQKLDKRSKRGGKDDSRRDKKAAPPQQQAQLPDGAAKEQPQQQQAQQQKPSKKQLAKQPMNRMLDLSDPKTLKVFQAIEAHRVRAETRGDIPFHFTLRDGRVRKILVNRSTSDALEAGKLAIVEDGEVNRHVIVEAPAVPLIREVDMDAVRFAN